MSNARELADVCLMLEGTYPYVTGGVSAWTHDLITAHKDLSFHLVTLLPIGASTKLRYAIPNNVVSHSTTFVQQLQPGRMSDRRAKELCGALEEHLVSMQTR